MTWFSQSTLPKPTNLVDLLDDALGKYEMPRSHTSLHASSLTYEDTPFCPREYALMDAFNVKGKETFISTSMRVTFDIGESYSNLLRNKWLREHAVGHWKCLACGQVLEFQRAPVGKCEGCGSNKWDYQEVSFYDEETGIVGNIDLIINLGQKTHTVVEVKSISKDDFAKLKYPSSEHRVRTCLYLYLVSKGHSSTPWSPRISHQQARILYISKGFGTTKNTQDNKMLPFKEYVIDRDDSVLVPYLHKAKLLTKYRRKEGPMPHGICATAMCPRAMKCAVRKLCFSTPT